MGQISDPGGMGREPSHPFLRRGPQDRGGGYSRTAAVGVPILTLFLFGATPPHYQAPRPSEGLDLYRKLSLDFFSG